MKANTKNNHLVIGLDYGTTYTGEHNIVALSL
jgi:hypothetical protein